MASVTDVSETRRARHEGQIRMEEDSAAVLGNVRALRGLLRDCQARIRELESSGAALRKSTASSCTAHDHGDENEKASSQAVLPANLHPGIKFQLGMDSAASPSTPSSWRTSSERERSFSALTMASRPSLLRQDEDTESNYVGSYGKLVSFLKASRTEGAITELEAAELLVAVEDISRLGSGQQVRKSQPLFRGTSKQDFALLLPSMGIEVPELGVEKQNTTGERSAKLNASKEAIERFGSLLSEPGFNCRLRGEILEDAHVIVHGFSAPFDLLERYNISDKKLYGWVSAIAEQYRPNSYHNWLHALDVFQFCYISLARGQAGEYFEDQDVLALLTATVAHDAGHPGFNNAFLINTSSEVAITYNDKSPLENMHASLCFQTLRREGLNFLDDVPDADFKVFRGGVIDAILATDMSHHFELVDRFSARVSAKDINPFFKSNSADTDSGNARQKEDRRMLMQAFTHMADLGHCCRPWDVHRHMVVALETEFFQQGDKERDLGLPVMPLMDRTKDSAAASQGFFLSKMVTPLLESCCVVLVDELGQTLQSNTSVNGYRWAGLIRLHGRLTAAQLVEKETSEELDGAPVRSDSGLVRQVATSSLKTVHEAEELPGTPQGSPPSLDGTTTGQQATTTTAQQGVASPESQAKANGSQQSVGKSSLRRLRGAGLG